MCASSNDEHPSPNPRDMADESRRAIEYIFRQFHIKRLDNQRHWDKKVESVKSLIDNAKEKYEAALMGGLFDHVLWISKLSGYSISTIAFYYEKALSHPKGTYITSPKSNQDLAFAIAPIIPSEDYNPPKPNTFIRLRTCLFAHEPTSMLRGMIRDDPGDRRDTYAVLSVMEKKHNFNIAQSSIDELLPEHRSGLVVEPEFKKVIEIFEQAGVDTRSELHKVKNDLSNLQRLQALVTLPEDISSLLRSGYNTIEGIVKAEKDLSDSVNIPAHRVASILRKAKAFDQEKNMDSITKNNEDRLNAAKKLEEDISQGKFNGEDDKGDGDGDGDNSLSGVSGTEGKECEEYTSITSPAAYFVDLLHALKKIKVGKRTLLDRLLERRPDLGDLRLSCVNTKVLIPYIDLVNEVLESVLWYRVNGNLKIQPVMPFNMDYNDTSDSYIARPKNTDSRVYQEILQPMVSPLQIFPYNQATHSMRSFFKALGVSRSQFIATLANPHRLKPDKIEFEDAQAIICHAVSAEILGLQHEDFVAIAHESFYPPCSLGDDKNYEDLIQLRPTAHYWSFENDQNMGQELTNIKQVLLPATGLSFPDLLILLKTKYLNSTLVIESGPKFAGRLEDMRLRQLHPDKITSDLDVDICDRLHRFIRLNKKLQWPIAELDAILFTLSDGHPVNINAHVLDNLAAVKQLSDLTDRSPLELQPLWGNIDTHCQDSLFARLFPKRSLPTAVHGIFDLNEDGELTQKDGKINDYLHPIALALGVSSTELKDIKDGAPVADTLSVASLSELYRIALFCKILDISPRLYFKLPCLFHSEFSFGDPQSTLNLVQKLQSPVGNPDPWTIKQLLFVIHGDATTTDEKYHPTRERHLGITNALESRLAKCGLEKQDKDGDTREGLAARTEQLITQLFGWKDAQNILKLINDKEVSNEGSFAQYLSPILGSDSTKALFERILNSSEITARHSVFVNTVTPVVAKTRKIEAILACLRVYFPELDSAMLRFALTEVIQHSEVSSALDGLLQLGEPLPTDKEFDGYFLPPSTDKYTITCVTEEPSELFIDGTQLKFSVPEYTVPQTNQAAANDAQPHDAKSGGSTTRHSSKSSQHHPPTAETDQLVGGQWHYLQYKGPITDLKWTAQHTVGVLPGDFTRHVLVPKAVEKRVSEVTDQLMRLSVVITRFHLSLPEVQFFHKASVFNLRNLSLDNIRQLERYSFLREGFSRNGAKEPLLALYKWLHLPASKPQTQPKDQESQTPKEQESPVPSPGQILQNFYAQVAAVTSWPVKLCSDLIGTKYLNLEVTELVDIFKDISALFDLHENVKFIKKLNLSDIPLRTLFDMAIPPKPKNVKQEFDHAAILQSALDMRSFKTSASGSSTPLSTAHDEIRTGQRTALIHRLLSQEYKDNTEVMDPDRLFGLLLIDVQMGPVLQTSRIKQALSTVQLFIQRCMLGAEKEHGIESKDVIGKADWTHLMRYRVWEANRKTGLYPENWIDPTLRDDKSEQFMSFESAVMQTNLDMESITALIKDYVHSVNDIADLQIESYLWERERNDSEDHIKSNFHIFGRTRTAPFLFYYRQLNVRSSENEKNEKHIAPYWSPWSKMDVDVSVLELDADGKRLPHPGAYMVPAVHNHHLFVFLPEIILGQQHADAAKEDKQYLEFQKQKTSTTQPVHHWEIRMGYTERRHGKWTPKRVSQSTIRVQQDKEKPQPLPHISNFQFWIEHSQPDHLLIVVEHVSTTSSTEHVSGASSTRNPRYLGKFELRGQQLIVVNDNKLPARTQEASDSEVSIRDDEFRENQILTEFSKLNQTVAAGKRLSLGSNYLLKDGSLYEPSLLWDGKEVKEETHFNWVLSFDDVSYKFPTGFVLEESTSAHIKQYLAFPGPDWNKCSNKVEEKANDQTLKRLEKLLENLNKKTNPPKSLIDRLTKVRDGKLERWSFGNTTEDHFNKQILTNSMAPDIVKSMGKEDGLEPIYQCLRRLDKDSYSDAFGRLKKDDVFHERATPSAIYNWELAVHIPSLLMERLMAAQQYELAITVARLIFDPTTDSNDRWSFPPFRNDKLQKIMRETNTNEGNLAIEEWRESNCNVHAAARGSPTAYMKRIQSKYVETLIAMGDEYFVQNTLESVPFAIQMYTEASHVLGPQQEEMPRLGQRPVKTFNELSSTLNEQSNPKIDLKLVFPFYRKPLESGNVSVAKAGAFLHTDYFPVASNPYMTSLKKRVDDRLFKIRNGMDINGNKQKLALFEPPLDPGALVQANAGRGGGVAGLLAGLSSPMPNYRFSYLIQHAFEVVNELKALGQQFLSVKEKKDAEGLSLLRCKHQNVLLDLMKRVKNHQKTETEKSIIVLEETRKQQEVRMQYYLSLTGDTSTIPGEGDTWTDIEQAIKPPPKKELRAAPCEQEEMDKADEASGFNLGASTIEAVAAQFFALPTFTTEIQPFGIGMSVSAGGNELGQSISSKASILRIFAQKAQDQGAQAGRKAGLLRQLHERRMEANMVGHELMRIDKEMEQLRARVDSCDAEIDAQQQEIENAAAEEELLRNKYTSQQLYTLLENSLGTLFHQTYMLANEMAKVARRALDFEHALRYPNSTTHATQLNPGLGGYWENSRDGLLSGETLYLDLKRMEMMHLENKTHDFEIAKTVSLRQLNPEALLELRENGTADFKLPELLFDMDFPGHYCRRIASVSISIPCILGGYTSLNGTLTLLKHKYRISPITEDAKAYAAAKNEFHTDRIPITSIAVSSGIQDGGTFNLDFHGNEKYGPFEGAGAISTWRLDLPKEIRQFDYHSITDIVLHLRYTAVSGGKVLSEAASGAAQKALRGEQKDEKQVKQNLPELAIDLRNDYPAEWHRRATTGKMVLSGLKKRFPFWTRGKEILVEKAKLVTSLASSPKTVQVVDSLKKLSEDVSEYTVDISGPELEHAWLVVSYSVPSLGK